MEKGQITMPIFQSLDAYWPGLQVMTMMMMMMMITMIRMTKTLVKDVKVTIELVTVD